MARTVPTHTAVVVGCGWCAATQLRLVDNYWMDNYGMLYRPLDGDCANSNGLVSLDLATLTPIGF